MSNNTKQAHNNGKKWQPGESGNISGKGGFRSHPENRSNGRWSKDTSISYWYNKFGRMTDEERKEFQPETDFQRIALRRIEVALGFDELALKTTKEITDRTDGRPRQDIDMNIESESLSPIIKGFVLPTLPDHFIEKDIVDQVGEDYVK